MANKEFDSVVFNTKLIGIDVKPNDGKKFTLDELQGIVGGNIDFIELPAIDRVMVVADEGKLAGLPFNENATILFKQSYPIDQYPLNNDQTIVGNVLVCKRDFVF